MTESEPNCVDVPVPVTSQIAEFVVCADLSDVGSDVLHLATRAFIDTVGVGIAGANDASVKALIQAIEPRWDLQHHKGAVSLTNGMVTTAVHAALINGTAGHALDFDDHLSEVNGHPSVVTIPALLALGQKSNASGRALLEAYVVGYQVMCAISAALPVRPHWKAGWHATGTVGVMGSAAACSRLLGLTIPETQTALGIAASFASGSRQNCGFLVKPLHAGMAASNGLLAAQLAQGGYTADQRQLESPLGYFSVFGVNPDLSKVAEVLSQRWALTDFGLNVKQFPACYAVHPAAAAAKAIAEQGVDPSRIQSVEVAVQPTGLVGPIHHAPITGLQGKFSIEYTTAVALVDQELGLSTFEDHAVLRPELQRLLGLVQAVETDVPSIGDPEFEKWFAVVSVHMKDGTKLEARADMPHGYGRDPLTDEELNKKFRDCATVPGSAWDAEKLLKALWSLPEMDGVQALLRTSQEPTDPALFKASK